MGKPGEPDTCVNKDFRVAGAKSGGYECCAFSTKVSVTTHFFESLVVLISMVSC